MSLKDFRRNVIDDLVAHKLVTTISLPIEISIPLNRGKICQPESVRLEGSEHQPLRTTRRKCGLRSTKQKEVRTN
uniref:dCTP deaminase n=1 Tax=Strongyloides stercoralis TaxID=6248 RepID=A0A0K0EK75_STRER